MESLRDKAGRRRFRVGEPEIQFSKRSFLMTKVMGAVFVGIDVSACTLVVALERDHQPGRQRREFPNTAAGHQVLIQWLSKSATAVQVCLEATGLYSLDLALALDRARQSLVAALQDR